MHMEQAITLELFHVLVCSALDHTGDIGSTLADIHVAWQWVLRPTYTVTALIALYV
jgi:hypothetical protein